MEPAVVDRQESNERNVRVIVADDQPLARLALRMLLEAHPLIDVVSVASNRQEAVQQVGKLRPDVVIMDMRMPNAEGAPVADTAGISATRDITRMHPATKVLVHSDWDEDPLVLAAMRAGACGYLRKADRDPDHLALIVLIAATGASVFNTDRNRMRQLFDAAHTSMHQSALQPLTSAEREVVNIAATAGEPSNQEIAARLGIARQTVANRILEARTKLGAADRRALIALAREAGLGTEP